MAKNHIGSLIARNTESNNTIGFIKVVKNSSTVRRKRKYTALVTVSSLAGFSAITAIFFLSRIWSRYRLRKAKLRRHAGSSSSSEAEWLNIPGLPRRFGYEELDHATEHFMTLIGTGGFGAVYKGTLPDKTVVAVKKMISLGTQGRKDFCSEIAIIGNIHHVNLVKLRGFCVHEREYILVYDYMNHGSLDKTLFSDEPVLQWRERFHIALGAANGLAYLHASCVPKILHCDIKPENILLHDNFQARISDFGLSKLLPSEESSLFTTMRGTRGYLAPEWLTSSSISEKTDVYSFGMVLLELVSGRKNCSLQAYDGQNHVTNQTRIMTGDPNPVYFPLFALEMHEKGQYLKLVDPRLEGRVPSDEVEKLVRIALCCVHEVPALRPSMSSVVGMLEGNTPLSQPNIEHLNFLRFYGQRFEEASMAGEDHPFEVPPFLHTTDSASPLCHGGFSDTSSRQLSGPR